MTKFRGKKGIYTSCKLFHERFLQGWWNPKLKYILPKKFWLWMQKYWKVIDENLWNARKISHIYWFLSYFFNISRMTHCGWPCRATHIHWPGVAACSPVHIRVIRCLNGRLRFHLDTFASEPFNCCAFKMKYEPSVRTTDGLNVYNTVYAHAVQQHPLLQ